jgi:NADH-ubiquinone oxidoreductase chain 2
MIISSILLLLLSNAVTLRRDKSILFSRTVIIGLLYSSFLAYNNLYIKSLAKGIGIYGGLFNVTTFTLSFNIFIFLVSAVILTLSAFYPRKVYYETIFPVKDKESLGPVGVNFNLPTTFSMNSVLGLESEWVTKIKRSFNLNMGSNIFGIENNDAKDNIISNKTGEQFRIIEYPLIIVFILCGAAFLISTGDLISIFLSIELQSYGLYILSTIYRDSESATASGLTYFLLGGLASCFILLGSALLYANSGTTNLDNIYLISSISQITDNNNPFYLYEPNYIHLSLIIMAVGFLIKISAAPFHFWSPDVYDGIPTIVTTYVAIVPKISIFAFFLELVYYTESSFVEYSSATATGLIEWKNILLLSSLFSLIIGSVLGLTQFRIKRLFAYSTISHIGFILLALSINNLESVQAYIFYIFQYSISNLNAFIILVTIGYTFFFYKHKKFDGLDPMGELTEKNNSPVQLINQIKGYFYINHFVAISLAITLFSFVGVPPLIGFFAKQMVLSAALDSGYVFMTLVAIITSVIGAAYYLNLIKQIFFYKQDYYPSFSGINNIYNLYLKQDKFEKKLAATTTLRDNVVISSSLSSSISILTLLLIIFMYIPGEWFNIVSILTLVLFKS